MSITKPFLLLTFLLAVSPLFAITNDDHKKEELILTKNAQEIKIDGILDEEIWDNVNMLDMSMYAPVNGVAPTERTEIKLTYDNEFIYIGAKMYISNPDDIRINSFARDVPTSGSEFNFFFTSDYQNLEGFSVNPAGRRVDAQILCNTDCDNWFNVDWNVIWFAETTQTDQGWFVEAKVPISSLNFNVEDEKLSFGFIAHRLIGAKNERYTFPNISPEWPNGPFRASLAHKMSIDKVKQKKPLYITPYVLGSYTKSGVDPEKYNGAFGLDVRYKISNNSSLDVTYNTDFSTVESDDQQLNLTQFSLFYPEKRQFFQERSGVFAFNTFGSERLFYSRRIGLDANGSPTKIIGGARSVSKLGKWDVGLINMQTEKTDVQNGENFGIFRVKRTVLNPASYIGSMVTSRLGGSGSYNYNIALDAVLNVKKTDFVAIKLINTQENGSNTVDLNSSLLGIEWNRPSNFGVGYTNSIYSRGKNYNPAVGFVTRKDHVAMYNQLKYGWPGKKGSKIGAHGPSIATYFIQNYTKTNLEFHAYRADYLVQTLTGNKIYAGILNKNEIISEGFDISGQITIPANNYSYTQLLAKYTMSQQYLFRVNVDARIGELYDGKGYSLTLSPSWTQSKLLEISSMLQLNQYQFSNRNEALNSLIAQLKLRFSVNTKLSVNVLGQYNTAVELFGVNSRIRYNFRDGHDLYFVYNESQNYNAMPMEGLASTSTLENRGLFLKYIYTFVK